MTLSNHTDNREGVRARLGMPLASVGRMRLELIGRYVPKAARSEAPPVSLAYAPFNFLKLPGWKAIVKLVALRRGVCADDVVGPSQVRSVVDARQEAMYLIRRHCERSLPEIGLLFDRDHTTVLHSIRKVERLRRANG